MNGVRVPWGIRTSIFFAWAKHPKKGSAQMPEGEWMSKQAFCFRSRPPVDKSGRGAEMAEKGAKRGGFLRKRVVEDDFWERKIAQIEKKAYFWG